MKSGRTYKFLFTGFRKITLNRKENNLQKTRKVIFRWQFFYSFGKYLWCPKFPNHLIFSTFAPCEFFFIFQTKVNIRLMTFYVSKVINETRIAVLRLLIKTSIESVLKKLHAFQIKLQYILIIQIRIILN